jgi:hydroxyacylglutathione hydrolase
MLLKRFYDAGLAQASYLIGCQATGDAIVVDANRDVEAYIQAAANENVSITHVTETHIHADFVSGSRELAARTGAQLLLSNEGGDDWRYAFASDANTRLLHDGDTIDVGNIRLDVVHTPGHTPEHLTFIITDTPATDRAMGALTGDFIFVGDVGRPDLLERAAKIAGTMEAGAHALFASLQRFKQRPDYLQLWPGHGAGSACGKALGAVPSTTLGYERIANWGLVLEDEDAFVREVLAGQPEPPKYFAEMKRINRDGPTIMGEWPKPAERDLAYLLDLQRAGQATIVDIRSAAKFAERHAPNTISIPLNKSFPTWAGSIIPFDHDIHLIVDTGDGSAIDQAVRALVMIGLERITGYTSADALESLDSAATTPQMSVAELAEHIERDDVQVLDVRGASEWQLGHIEGARHIPLGELQERIAEIPHDKPIAVHCQGGGRSAIAASILQRNGFTETSNVTGGFGEWEKEQGAVSSKH